MRTIRHTVAFALPSAPGSSEERAFLAAARRLATIPGVEDFTVLRALDAAQPLPRSFSMEFADRAAYDGYDAHPLHRDFVERLWLPTVTAFAETDFAIEPAGI